MSVLLTSAVYINSVLTPVGTTVSLGYDKEEELVSSGAGTWVVKPTTPTPPATIFPITSGGPLTNGVWVGVPSVFRLRLIGTGTITVDSQDRLGNITIGAASYTISGATDQIEFPYAGDHAVAIRATFTGSATAEVI